MMVRQIYPNRRRYRRLNFTFEISLPNHIKGKTRNVSANGVSFEVITDDVGAFSPGAIIPLKIISINTTHGSKQKTICLSGRGLIIREEIIDTANCNYGTRLNIVVKLLKRFNFWEPSNN